MSMRFGVFVPQGWRMDLTEIADPVEQYEAMTAVAKLADAGPWDSVWVYDHFHTTPEPTINTTFEAWTVSSTLARDTSRVNIGQMVGCNGYRHPALYAKIASTVDVASHGRLYAGLGAGWYEHEWKAYGYEWSEVPDRMRAFREAVEIVHKMWTEERPVFSGRHYRIDQPINEPKGVRKPHPSFWLGGGGEKVTLKLVARYADGCNFANGDPEVFRQKAAVLRQHCDTLGRDPGRIAKSTSYQLDPKDSTADTIGKLERLAEAGCDYVIVYIPRVAYDHEPLLRFAEDVIPQLS
ncbi:LLM class F420-dependent oxidoreductase [Actinoplanes sp. NPDC049802]|uniref:LLM class F420-dependent oxidoreductase n=1 Tax=Actinoplanes sp. NPDC049802 TaxID=3154742 RepID=UPI0033F785D8